MDRRLILEKAATHVEGSLIQLLPIALTSKVIGIGSIKN